MVQILLKYLKTQMLISNLSRSIYGNECEDRDKNIFTLINYTKKQKHPFISEIPNVYGFDYDGKIVHNSEVILLTAKYLSY